MREALDLLAGVLMLLVGVQRMYTALRARPFGSVPNSRRLLFGALALSGGIYWTLRVMLQT